MIRRFFEKNWLMIASGIAVIIIFHFAYGLEIILPSNISWLLTIHHDWGANYLGWYFYRNEPWHFPLGEIHNFFYPIGTNVGFTDSVPMLAIFFKLFAVFLSEDFQYFGIWFFACHLLTAYFTIRLFKLFKVNQIFIFVAVLFITANPVLIYRGMHPGMYAHWLLIASIYLYFLNPNNVKPQKILLYQFILLILSAMINPYMSFMILGFTFIIPLRLSFFDKVLSKKSFFIYNAISIFALLFSWYLVGMLNFKTGEDLAVTGGYGLYGLNLNSLFNSFGFSTFLPQLKQVSSYQYEGFMYLGLGIMFLLVILMVYKLYTLVKNKKKETLSNSTSVPYKTNLFLIILLFVMFSLFSITHIVSLNDKVLFKIPIPKNLIKIGEIFRASARFFWPVYYSILLFCIIAIAKSKLPRFVKLSVTFIALFIQFYDTKGLFTYRHLTYGSYEVPIDEKSWSTLFKEFDEIVLYPPFQTSYLANSDYQDFCYLAAKDRKPITTGYLGRVDNKSVNLYMDSLEARIAGGEISSKKIYITTAANLETFSVLLQNKTVQLNILDNYYYLFANDINKPVIKSLSEKLNSQSKYKLDSALQLLANKNQFTKTIKIDFGQDLTIRHSVEKLNDYNKFISAKGWAFVDSTKNNKGDSVFFVLNSNTDSYIAPAKIKSRPDVTSYFHKSYLDDAGFNTLIFKDDVERGAYELGIAIKNSQGRWIYQKTDKIINVGMFDYATIKDLEKLPPVTPIKFNLESLEAGDSIIKSRGWAYLPDQDNDNCKISLILTKGEKNYIVETELVLRQDVTSYFKSQHSLDHTGFSVKMRNSSLPPGKYQIGIMIKDLKTKKEGITFLDRYIEIK